MRVLLFPVLSNLSACNFSETEKHRVIQIFLASSKLEILGLVPGVRDFGSGHCDCKSVHHQLVLGRKIFLLR